MWFTAGVLSNPATDAIMADTGPLSGAGSGSFRVVLGANIATIGTIEHRNAANNANINSQVIGCSANTIVVLTFPDTWADGERVRLRLNVGIVGSTQASIFTF